MFFCEYCEILENVFIKILPWLLFGLKVYGYYIRVKQKNNLIAVNIEMLYTEILPVKHCQSREIVTDIVIQETQE